MTTTQPDLPETHASLPRTRRTRRALAVLGAAGAALAVWAVAAALSGGEPAARTNGATRPVGPAAVVIVALLAGLAGWALLAALERFGRRPRRTWTAAAVTVLAVSLAGPLGNGAGASARIALAAVHLATGAVLIPLLRRSARPGD